MYSYAPLIVLILLMGASMWIGVVANRATEKGGGFLKGYFLGNRGLGSWSMALTATVMSGGTFMGFPSLVFEYGWVVALWIASYMVVPLCTFGVIGKRMGQLSRLTGAITLPELLRERFRSPALGLAASLFMIFVLSVGLVAQFKSGAIILQKVLPVVSLSAGPILGQQPEFVYGLIVFTLVVAGYTVYGGFLAAVWTDLFQSVLMAVGVLILLPLVLIKVGGLEAGTLASIQSAGPEFAYAPGRGRDFMTPQLAFSFFALWSIAGMGQPATLVRLMAFRDTKTLRHALFLLGVYNTLIYLPLVFIFVCAKSFVPELKSPDEAMPAVALAVASPWVAGIILAAPFGAVMATVSGYLVQISSSIVQDVYHRWKPDAPEQTLRRLSHSGIILVAVIASAATMKKIDFLQAIIVFAGGAAACAYLVPAIMAAFWRRANAAGALAALLGGSGTVVLLYVLPWIGVVSNADPLMGEKSSMYPIYLLGMTPFVWGMLVSLVLGVGFSLATPPMKEEDVAPLF